MGGEDPYQMFNAGTELAEFIAYVQARSAARIALVINGDFVDFLAEPDAVAFDPVNAVRKLNRIAGDPAFAPVFTALKSFLRAKGRHVIITLGNHDLELALPWVRDHLARLLTGGNERARSQLTLEFDGTGFLCQVGNARAFCIHGNEVDDWNYVNHERLRQFGRDIQQGRLVEPWIPNAGTRLVIDVMNGIKRKFAFVDLLKPEVGGVVRALAAIAPEEAERIDDLIPVLLRLARDSVLRLTGFLGETEQIEGRASGRAAVQTGSTSLRMDRDMLLAAVEGQLLRNKEPIDLVPRDLQGQYLGTFSGIFGYFFGGISPSEALRDALEEFQHDLRFSWEDASDTTYRAYNELIGDEIDFVLTGHTHLERALPRRTGGEYFNSGTWARLIRFAPEVLVDAKKFAKVYEALAAGPMADLDAHPDLVLRWRTVVMISDDGSRTHGQLMRWRDRKLVTVQDASANPAG